MDFMGKKIGNKIEIVSIFSYARILDIMIGVIVKSLPRRWSGTADLKWWAV
jgi:hypothetical protein